MKFSIVMATLNSMRTIEASLKSIRAQNYPQDQIEIMVIDGGSTDGTRELAARMGCRVLDNPEVIPVSAKLIGLREATGDWLMHLDSDEVLCSPDALAKRARIFRENPDLKMIFSEGYKNPEGTPFAARYINEFGDPFSCFFYRLSKDYRFFVATMKRKMTVVRETEDYVVLDVAGKSQPIMENAACGNVIDLEFFRTNFPELCKRIDGFVHFFYHMQRFTTKFALTKSDEILHYSADHWQGLLRKTRWRIENNLFYPDDLGESGFRGRLRFEGSFTALKPYLYIPYAFLLLPLMLDTLYLIGSRRDFGYWQHVPFTLYTASMIVGLSVFKLFGFKPERKTYGGGKPIVRPS